LQRSEPSGSHALPVAPGPCPAVRVQPDEDRGRKKREGEAGEAPFRECKRRNHRIGRLTQGPMPNKRGLETTRLKPKLDLDRLWRRILCVGHVRWLFLK